MVDYKIMDLGKGQVKVMEELKVVIGKVLDMETDLES